MSAAPATISDEFFGCMVWAGEIGALVGSIEWKGRDNLKVQVAAESIGEAPAALKSARELFRRIVPRFDALYGEVREEYVKIYNESWSNCVNGLGEPVGHGKIDAEKFDEAVYLEEIWFAGDGRTELCFYDGDEFFGGHTITVTLDSDLKVIRSGLDG